jgi:hypothetical protein
MRLWDMSKSENFSDLDLPVSALYALGAPAGVFFGGESLYPWRWNRISVRSSLDEALERQRGKLVAMLAMHRMSPARRAGLRQRLATVDEIIRLGLH